MIRQTQNKKRNFTYYVHWTRYRKSIVPKRLSKKREYYINFNFDVNATNEQVLKAYFFGLKFDEILNQKLDERLTPEVRQSYARLTEDQERIRNQCLSEAIFEAEEYFELFDHDKFIQQLKDNKWKLDTLYIDRGTNRYKIE